MGDDQIMSGPCIVCGRTNYPLSCGGPSICPPCDCGSTGEALVALQRDEIERLRAEVAQLRSERDFLVEEYERAVGCGEQGYIHCASHLFNAITNARIDANIAERELAELRERFEKAPVGYLNAYPDGYRFLLDSHGTWGQMEEQENSFSAWIDGSKRVRLVVEP